MRVFARSFTLNLNYLKLDIFGAHSPTSGAKTLTAQQMTAHKAVEQPP